MSRSDKNIPWEIRQDDPTFPGKIDHDHLEIIWGVVEGCSAKVGFILHSCDYDPRGNTLNFKSTDKSRRCTRRVGYFNWEPVRKVDRKTTERQFRRSINKVLHDCVREGTDTCTEISAFISRRNLYS